MNRGAALVAIVVCAILGCATIVVQHVLYGGQNARAQAMTSRTNASYGPVDSRRNVFQARPTPAGFSKKPQAAVTTPKTSPGPRSSSPAQSPRPRTSTPTPPANRPRGGTGGASTATLRIGNLATLDDLNVLAYTSASTDRETFDGDGQSTASQCQQDGLAGLTASRHVYGADTYDNRKHSWGYGYTGERIAQAANDQQAQDFANTLIRWDDECAKYTRDTDWGSTNVSDKQSLTLSGGSGVSYHLSADVVSYDFVIRVVDRIALVHVTTNYLSSSQRQALATEIADRLRS